MGFSNDFLWGAASAAHQIEGAYLEDGKGLGIWDALCEGKVAHFENGQTACDHYHRYKEDVALMKQIGLKSYRFSISWPRIVPEEGKINEEGIRFYQDLVKELKAAEIEPLCTLYHWNMPMWMYEKGGWLSDQISDYFAEFAEIMVEALSEDVCYWMTLNEPASFIGSGYITGSHAPFQNNMKDPQKIGQIMPQLCKNVLLSHGKAAAIIREKSHGPVKIGMALNGRIMAPLDESKEAIEEAKKQTFAEENSLFGVSMWADAAIDGKLDSTLAYVINEEELNIIHQPLDFFGYNCYNTSNYDDRMGKNKNAYPGLPRTTIGWPITPDALYWAARFFYEKYKLPILITENGMTNVDFIMTDEKIHDVQRIEYIKMYLKELKRAADEGIPVIGYQYWSIMDNFEWAEGFDKRFGLIYVDYRTQDRIMKDSAYWYSELIQSNGKEI